MKTKEIAVIAICTALMAVLSPLSIPLAGGVPISLATFVVMLVGSLLSPGDSCIVVALYIVLAFIGVPVLSGYSSGASILFGMTGGYIFGYIPLAIITSFVVGLAKKKSNKAQMAYMAIGMLAGNLALYLMGTWWFMKYTGMDISASLAACVIPFIPGDLIKMVIVEIVSPRLQKIVER